MFKILLCSLGFFLTIQGFSQFNHYSFIENKGQIADFQGNVRNDILFSFDNGNGTKLFLSNTGVYYQLEKYNNLPTADSKYESELFAAQMAKSEVQTYRIDVELMGSNPNPHVQAFEQQQGYLNFYNTPNPEGVTGVNHFAKIIYKDIYPGIDWIWKYDGTKVKYDFVVHSGADYKLIKFKIKGTTKLQLKENGELEINSPLGSINEAAPLSYNDNNLITSKFIIEEDVVSFNVGGYNHEKTLVIDPILLWSGYFGGSDIDLNNGSSLDQDKNQYICGLTLSNAVNFISGGHQNAYGGLGDAFLFKVDSNGNFLWGTYYGGSLLDFGYAVACNSKGDVFLGGGTKSTNSISYSGFQNSLTHTSSGYSDAFLVKFNNNGVRQWATYYGGQGYDECQGIAVDKNDNIYITGTTSSNSGIAYNGFKNNRSATSCFLVKFLDNGNRVWGTYYGEGGTDPHCVATDKIGNVYMAGETYSNTGIAYNGHQNTIGQGADTDAFLVKFDSNCNRIWGTYYGGGRLDLARGLAIDSSMNVFLAGTTESYENIYYKGYLDHKISDPVAFLVKFDSSGVRKWGTYTPGTGHSYVAVDSMGNSFFVGATFSTTDVFFKGLQQNLAGGYDGMIIKFDTAGQRVWGTYFGGTGDEHIVSVFYDNNGKLYLTAEAGSSNLGFGTPYKSALGKQDILVFKISESDLPYIKEPKKYSCYMGGISLTASKASKAFTLRWFNDSTSNTPVFVGDTFNISATKSDTMWVAQYNGSILWPKSPVYITVFNSPKADFRVNDSSQCLVGNNFIFTDSSKNLTSTYTSEWFFGNNDSTTIKNPMHTYLYDSVYNAKLIILNDNGCKDSIIHKMYVYPLPKAGFAASPLQSCFPTEVSFSNSSTIKSGVLKYKWHFGDGDSAVSQNTKHIYKSDGLYKAKLIVTSDENCVDSSIENIEQYPLPVKGKVLGTVLAQKNSSHTYSITSTATSYNWVVVGGTQISGGNSNTIQINWGAGNLGYIKVSGATDKLCTDVLDSVIVSLLNTGVENNFQKIISIQPNPANDILNIISDIEVKYTLTNILGSTLRVGQSSLPIDVSSISPGIYFITLEMGDKIVGKEKIIISR